ncbi:hypothetical protein EIP91_002209 [Steccherinum ochraceum]|uniref:Uncharacterized protein n=1 Tax=Steccherinum ochraceum TaxID=92696 RepID=A0A4R0RCI7_9APHY|nr:hypothetical protein EIP91_002209 [Steccherinum ochraceum]
MTIIVHNERVFTSPNVTYPPTNFEDGSKLMPARLSLPELRWPRSAYPEYPQLAFCLARPDWSGPLLDRLDLTYGTAPVEKINGSYHMKVSLQQSWISLESALLWMGRTLLLDARAQNRALLGLDFVEFRLPSTYGYGSAYDNDHDCRRSIVRSRNAFIPLMALCSYAIAVYHADGGLSWRHSFPDWAQALVARGAGHDWVSDILSSQLADFSWEGHRVGVVIDPRQRQLWWNHVAVFIKAKVPLWVYWGKVGELHAGLQCPPAIASWQPSNEAIQRTVLRGSSRREPPIQDHSGQLPGEDIADFLCRRERENSGITDSDGERVVRIQRTAHSEKHLPPGNSSSAALVFEWLPCEYPEWPYYLVRTRVPRSMVQTVWCGYASSQMRYDAYHNEWDLCEALDASATREDEGEGEYHGEFTGGLDVQPSVCQDATRLAPARHRRDDDGHFKAWTYAENVFGALYQRMGLLATEDSDMQHWASTNRTDKQLAKLLGVVTEALPVDIAKDASLEPLVVIQPSEKAKKVLCAFANALLLADSTFKKSREVLCDIAGPPRAEETVIAKDIWDLNPEDSRTLRKTEAVVIEVEEVAVEGNVPLADDVSTSTTRRYVVGVRSSAPSDAESGGLRLVVEDPSVAVQLLRVKGLGRNIQEIGAFLADNVGAPFRVRDKTRIPSPYLCRPATPLLGWVKEGFRFNEGNYEHYEHVRNRALQRGLSSLALRAGGIIWRLAKEMESVSGEMRWYDDMEEGEHLTEEEEDMICGMYKVYTGRGGMQTEDASWWPKQSVWLKGGLSAGQWTDDCETWFRTWRHQIVHGRGQPKNANTWKKALKYYKKDTEVLRERVRTAAKRYLDAEGTPTAVC